MLELARDMQLCPSYKICMHAVPCTKAQAERHYNAKKLSIHQDGAGWNVMTSSCC